MSKELTKEQRGAIIYCRQRGDSYRTIATTVGCGVSTVFDTLKWMDKIGTTDSRPHSATVKHSPSQMHWGCFSRQGVGPIVSLSGTATGTSHVAILQKYVIPTMRRAFPNGDGWFQEDNARPHTSKVTKKFHTENDLRVLSWPAQSPDLNPIENLWAIVKKSIHERKKHPSNIAELDRYVKKAWQDIPIHTIENLVDSMPQRIQAVIDANRGPIKY
jgi:transposase